MHNTTVSAATGEDTPLNQTQDSVIGVKRTPSLNESHYSVSAKDRLGPDPEPIQIYENLSSSEAEKREIVVEAMAETSVMSTQTDAQSPLRPPPLVKEGSFIRTGSGRKLPKVPNSPDKSSTLPGRKQSDVDKEAKNENRKSKPKALEFWETMEETIDRTDFRYNTIHRMSMGRRMLPKPPGSGRSQSLDRSADINHRFEDLDNSFSEVTKTRKDSESSLPSRNSSPSGQKKIPADGCSIQSSGSGEAGVGGQPASSSSDDTRGEVEGSSDNNSPPTSVVQGVDGGQWNPEIKSEVVGKQGGYTWMRNGFGVENGKQRKWSTPSPVSQELLKELNSDKYNPKYLSRAGDGKQSDCSSSIDGRGSNASNPPSHHIPYEVLLQDLTQAKRQLVELHSLVSA